MSPATRVQVSRYRASRGIGVTLAAAFFFSPACSFAQSASSASSFSAVPATITGKVINAVTGLPVPRALVNFNQQAMLTDHEGNFQFPSITSSGLAIGNNIVMLQVTKPGFSMSSEPNDQRNQQFQLDQLTGPIEIRIYPEAIITGTVISPEGEPLARVAVMARRGAFDEIGGYRWNIVGQAQTNTHGEFRIPVPSGDYRIETRYIPRNTNSSDPTAIMPVVLPTPGDNDTGQSIHMRNGQEQHFDLRPASRRTYPITIGIESRGGRGFPAVTARTTNGTTFTVGATPTRGPGGRGFDMSDDRGNDQARTATLNLPTGTYTLTARTQDQEGMEVAETRVTVTGAATSNAPEAVLRFVATPAIPVEIALDASATSDNAATSTSAASSTSTSSVPTLPNPQQFGLTLRRIDLISDEDQTIVQLMNQRTGSASFNAPPGTYRLIGRPAGRWYIRSATYGSTDLLGQPLVVGSGATSATIHLLVTNLTGGIQGTVKLNGVPSSSSIYLVANAPSVTPIIDLSSGATGAFTNLYLPPGSYQAIAFEHRHSADFTDPATLAAFSTYIQPVTITAGGQVQLNLNAVPQAEVESKSGAKR